MTVHVRQLTPQPSTLDAAARTVEAIVSTGADAARPGFVERLDLPGADLSRLVGGPVLDAHRASSTRDQLGVIEAAELRPEGLWVRIRFRSNDAARAVLADIGNGTLRGLSIGYTVAEWKETRDGDRRIRTAIRWTPLEVSIVPVPADPGAHFRHGSEPMETQEQTAERTAQTTTQTRAETNREIRSIATTLGLPTTWSDEQIDAEATLDAARASAFMALQARSAQTTARTTTAVVGMDHTDPAVIATRAGEALYAASHPEHEVSAPARAFVGLSFADHARESLRRSGVNTTGMYGESLITRALHTTSDFPLLLGDAVGRELRRAYAAAPSGIRRLARQTTARDFRAKRAIMLGEAPNLEKVNEHGEFESGTINESAETYSITTFGKMFGISRQALVNDDLGAFSRLPAMMGAAAARFVDTELTAKLVGNPVMSDNVAVFHASHGNLTATYAEPNVASLTAARLAIRKQKGLSGDLIGIEPKFILVPPELETIAEQGIASITPTKINDVNPFSVLSLEVDPRLTPGNRWYLAAAPEQFDGLEYAYLAGAPGPQVESRAGFEVDGLQIKVRLDFGCGWLDFRGWHRVG